MATTQTASESLSEISIDMHQQHAINFKYKRLYFGVSVALLLACTFLLFYDFKWSGVLLFVVIGLNSYQLLMQGFGKDPLHLYGKSYLTLNSQRIVYKPSRKAAQEILWQDVSNIELHLFEAELNLTNGGTSTINLEDLSDANLKLVKEWLQAKQMQLS